jgi:hypothetical protein
VAEQLSSGTGDFDEHHVLDDLPKKLKLADGKARTTVQNQAKDRKRTTLVQVRLHRLAHKTVREHVNCGRIVLHS